jgi:DNA mismatch endonuclease, patch repair protein
MTIRAGRGRAKPLTRSEIMSRVKNRDTNLELVLRKCLWRLGLRYRLGSRLPGKPDLVFPGAQLAVFIDGCFWHGCPIHFKLPKTNSVFWERKIGKNRERDHRVEVTLSNSGWTVLRVWEHSIRERMPETAKDIQRQAELNLANARRGKRAGNSAQRK